MASKPLDQTYTPRNEFSPMKQAFYPIIKQLVISMAIMPILYQWAHFERSIISELSGFTDR